MKKLKALGLAFVAVFAMSAMAAQAASAQDFEADGALAAITAGGDDHVLEVTGEDVVCGTVNFAGTPIGDDETFTSATVTPEYTDCTATALNLEAKITGFGHYGSADDHCDYVLHANGTADLVCDPGEEVTIDAVTCTVHIPPQTGLSDVSYTNVANGDIEIGIDIDNITATHTDGFLCPFSGSGEGNTGVLTGTSLAQGNVDVVHNDTE